MSADARTHAEILEVAMRLASVEGLASLTIGRLARSSHEVLKPGLDAPAGLALLESVCEAFLSYVERGVFPGGCFFAQLLGELDAQTRPIHDEVLANQRGWLALLDDMIDTALANFLSTLHRDPSVVEQGRRAVRAALARAAPR